MPSVLKFRQPVKKVELIVDGVFDDSIVSRMVRDVQRVFRHIVGGWRVSVHPSARGCWRLELAGARGRHVWMFAAPTRALSAAVVEKLETFLHDSSTPWHQRPARV